MKRIIIHLFHVYDNEVDAFMVYDMIMGHGPMVQLCMIYIFNNNVLEGYNSVGTMKDPFRFPGRPTFTKREII